MRVIKKAHQWSSAGPHGPTQSPGLKTPYASFFFFYFFIKKSCMTPVTTLLLDYICFGGFFLDK